MYQQPPRRRARAIAISRTLDERRKGLVTKALMLCGMVFGATEALWAVHHMLGAR